MSDMAMDWRSLPLTPGGRGLIEASAGTGKTWTIAALYLRLVLEGDTPLTPRQIVVTTFTDAAAQELRERIRTRLREAEAMAAAAPMPVAATMPLDEIWLRERWESAEQRQRDALRLRLAQSELDLAPIATLHGLCRRILADFPLASGGGFGQRELIAPNALIEELALDLWRRLQQAEDVDARHVEKLSELHQITRLLMTPNIGLWSPRAEALGEHLPAARIAEIEGLVSDSDLFARSTSKLKTALRALVDVTRDPSLALTETQSKNLRDTDISKQFKPHRLEAMRDHTLLRFAADAVRVLDYAAAGDRLDAWRRWRDLLLRWRDERLALRGELSFDSLIVQVADALRSRTALADALHAAWPVALVDEFQDTDALQYDILDRLYRDAEGALRGRLIMIGDPKQAIYRFRGGDIHAYLAAAASATDRLRLSTNYRSSRDYVAALNEWYALAGERLSTRDTPIAVHAMAASARRDAQPLRHADGGAIERALSVHYCSAPPLVAAQRRDLALRGCANHIATVLLSGERIGDRRVAPGDLAVLLPSNHDIAQLRGLLQERGVPCVGAGRSSVFETDWARELAIALYAAAHPADEGALRAALATRFGGWRFADFLAARDDTVAWTDALRRFDLLHRRWRDESVLSVVLTLADDAAHRLPGVSERERALTDLRHLGELLQAQEEEQQGPAQLMAWFATQRDGGEEGGDAADERQLRLESDSARVRLLTLHASKGLEFPIVFLPLMWSHSGRHEKYPVLHEPLAGQRVVGFGSGPREDAAREDQDERFRVLYVALTRAEHACHVYALPPDRAANARSESALGDPERSALDATLARVFEALRPGETLQDATRHVLWNDDDWYWPETHYRDPNTAKEKALSARHEPPRPRAESTYSFTALVAHHERVGPAGDEGESALGDAVAVTDMEIGRPHPRLQTLSAWRGADFGNALHLVFEKRVIGEPMATQRDLVKTCLIGEDVMRRDAVDEGLITAVIELVQTNLDAELAPGLRLGAVPVTQMRAEMAFHFVLDEVSTRALRDACARHGTADLIPPQLPSTTLRGLMTGKIDLVFRHDGRFHVLDYKSNFLGDRLQDYAAGQLGKAMDEHVYRFQALLYSVALQRYLRQRLPEYRRDRDLGEVFYLFLRGAGLAPGSGVWRHRFDGDLLDAVDAAFGAPAVTEAA